MALRAFFAAHGLDPETADVDEKFKLVARLFEAMPDKLRARINIPPIIDNRLPRIPGSLSRRCAPEYIHSRDQGGADEPTRHLRPLCYPRE